MFAEFRSFVFLPFFHRTRRQNVFLRLPSDTSEEPVTKLRSKRNSEMVFLSLSVLFQQTRITARNLLVSLFRLTMLHFMHWLMMILVCLFTIYGAFFACVFLLFLSTRIKKFQFWHIHRVSLAHSGCDTVSRVPERERAHAARMRQAVKVRCRTIVEVKARQRDVSALRFL